MYHSKGYGIKLWKKALEHSGPAPLLALDGVLEQVDNYKKSGFTPAGKVALFFVQGKQVVETSQSLSVPSEFKIISGVDANFENLKQYDKKHFLFGREKLLAYLVSKQASFVALSNSGEIVGFCSLAKVLRKDGGARLGPLFANSLDIAEHLLVAAGKHIVSHLSEYSNSDTIYLIRPEENKGGEKLVEKYKMESPFQCVRMYYVKEGGAKPNYPYENIYVSTSYEAG